MFDPQQFVADQTAEMRSVVGEERALVALSGGVDSAVVAALAHQAIGDQLISLFIDDGLMREDEGQMVVDAFAGVGM